ncbi:hypothetical protein FSP39_010819 [Pinctada imbricata]|uniref:Prolyl 4-hydroxylase alpha subunit domain-containing protein n=1 Tax=Pinctada imbricata TaxID=66713 RepID=A0AA88XRG9_PINIB|nr:hypothetical protein FSP39_010819 [Pinctada imbricata]
MSGLCQYLALLYVTSTLCLFHGSRSEQEGEFCVTTRNRTVCGDGGNIRLARIDGQQTGFSQELTLEDGRTVTMTTLSTKPLVLEVEHFLTDMECDYFVNMAEKQGLKSSHTQANSTQSGQFHLLDTNRDKKLDVKEMINTIEASYDVYLEKEDILEMYKSTQWDKNEDGYITPDETQHFPPNRLRAYLEELLSRKPEKHSRYSKQVWLYPDSSKDKIFSGVQKRVTEVTNLPKELIKLSDFQVVSYGVKGHYNAHFDSAELNKNVPCCTRDRTKQCRICRYMTILFYLNDVEGGGETAFPIANNDTVDLKRVQEEKLNNLYKKCEDANLLVTPSKGKAILWYNHFIEQMTDGWERWIVTHYTGDVP